MGIVPLRAPQNSWTPSFVPTPLHFTTLEPQLLWGPRVLSFSGAGGGVSVSEVRSHAGASEGSPFEDMLKLNFLPSPKERRPWERNGGLKLQGFLRLPWP